MRLPGDTKTAGLRNHIGASMASEEWLSRGSLPSRRHLAVSGDIFDCYDLGDATDI